MNQKYIIASITFLLLIFLHHNVYSTAGTGQPLKYISSCEMDFNNDNEPDIALLVETIKERQLIVLMKEKGGYKVYVPSTGKEGMHLSCHFGKEIKETTAGNGKGKIYKTFGTYIQLTQPEGASVVYFWNGNGFTQVWTSD